MPILKIIITLLYLTISLLVNAQQGLGNPDERIGLEYAIWRSECSIKKDSLLFLRARMAKDNGNEAMFRSSLDRLSPVIRKAPDVTHSIAKSYFMDGLFYDAYRELISMEDSTLLSRNDLAILWLLTHVEIKKYSYVSTQLEEFYSKNDLSYEPLARPEFKSPEIALRRSAFLPGLGMIYTQNYFEGFTSLALNAGFLYLGFTQFASGYLVAGAAVGVYPLFRFFGGGKTYSYHLVEVYNKEQREMYEQALRNQVLFFFEESENTQHQKEE